MLIKKINTDVQNTVVVLSFSEVNTIIKALNDYIPKEKYKRNVKIMEGYFSVILNILHDGSIDDVTVKNLHDAYESEIDVFD